jgi:predicted RNase H-like HicB family nuclease
LPWSRRPATGNRQQATGKQRIRKVSIARSPLPVSCCLFELGTTKPRSEDFVRSPARRLAHLDGKRVGVYHERSMKQLSLTAIIEREGDGYVALCPELDVASQGDTVDEARRNLVEAVELFFEAADPSEVQRRLHGEVFVTRLEVNVG